MATKPTQGWTWGGNVFLAHWDLRKPLFAFQNHSSEKQIRENFTRENLFFFLFCILMFGPCALFVGDELHLVWVSTFCNAFLSLFGFIDVGKV